mmetsp:Transcript_69657/g.145244  ORF Transcript_69657/g.145244 Transcript_69657/m.145244 type:complete len:89 (+) Transcript_69657:3-269(+)
MDEELQAKFVAAQETSRTDPPSGLNNDTKLAIYSLYKQAEVGPCNTERPGFFDQVGRAKYDAWAALGDMSKDEAKKQYIDVVAKAYTA